MNELMQALYTHVIDTTYEKYCDQTDFSALCADRDAIGRELWEQLPQDQRDLLEDLQRAYDRAQMCELEVMFLAAFDLIASLFCPHAP